MVAGGARLLDYFGGLLTLISYTHTGDILPIASRRHDNSSAHGPHAFCTYHWDDQ